MDRRFFAFDATTGKMLWQTTLDAPIRNSTVSYALNGKQYVAVLGSLAVCIGTVGRPGLRPVGQSLAWVASGEGRH